MRFVWRQEFGICKEVGYYQFGVGLIVKGRVLKIVLKELIQKFEYSVKLTRVKRQRICRNWWLEFSKI